MSTKRKSSPQRTPPASRKKKQPIILHKKPARHVSAEVIAQINRVMGQRGTAIDVLLSLATDPKSTNADRSKAATMLLQATGDYPRLDAEVSGATPPRSQAAPTFESRNDQPPHAAAA